MKHSNLLLVFFIFIFVIKIDAQNYGLDNSDPSLFTKYRLPDTDLRALWFNTSLSLNTDKQDNVNIDGKSSNYNSHFGYSLSPYYYLLQESEQHYLNFNANIYGSYNHSYSENHSLYSPNFNSYSNKQYSTHLTAIFTDNIYRNSGDMFYSFGSNINVDMSDTKSESNYYFESKSYNGSKYQNYSFLFGVGFGKVRNVTPVVSAIRFQERLKQINLLNHDLSDQTIEDLAQQFSRQNYYSMVHVRSGKYFWRSIDNALSRDGVSLNGLNMYSSSYLMETTGEIRFLRQEGFMAGINVNFNYQNAYQANSSNYVLEEDLYTLGNAYLNYSHQLNLDSQINFNLAVSGGPNVLAKPVARQMYYLDANAGYNYELTDRIVISLNNEFILNFWNESLQRKTLTNYLTFSVNYFIEDNISFNANYNWEYSSEKNNLMLHSDTINMHSINAGFTFYIDRGLIIN